MEKINANMTIQEILQKKPHAFEILIQYGMGCAGCHLGAVETLKEGAMGHGLTDEEIQELVDLINHDKIDSA